MNRVRHPLRVALYADGGLLLVTGIAWSLLHYLPEWFGQSERAVMSANAILMKLHGAAAMLALVLLGAMFAGHVQTGWQQARNRASGLSSLAIGAVLVVTGYLLYYAGAEATRAGASLLHLGSGLALPVVIVAHAFGRMRARRRHAALARALRARRRRKRAVLQVE